MMRPNMSALALVEVTKRLGRYREIEKIIRQRYAIVPGQKVAVRRSEIVEAVAAAMSQPWERVAPGNDLHKQVRETMTLLGARPVKRENRRLFLHVMRIGDKVEDAVAESAELLRVRVF